jgi:hypothetical protein
MFGVSMPTETLDPSSPQVPVAEPKRLAYSIQEAADLLGLAQFQNASPFQLIFGGLRILAGKSSAIARCLRTSPH